MSADQTMAFTSVSQWSCRSSLGSTLLVSTLTSVSRMIWCLLEVSSSSEILFQVLRDPAFMCDLPWASRSPSCVPRPPVDRGADWLPDLPDEPR